MSGADGGSKRLWDRGQPLESRIERFTVGRDPELDLRLVAYDALASAAHASMLCRIGVLTETERDALIGELRVIADDARSGRFVIARADEDCHTAIEGRLTERLGDSGRRIHTGRSRNDQVIAMLRLYGRERLLDQLDATAALVELLLELAARHRETTVAGYTHTRQAMPSTFGLLFGAHAELLLDDARWLETAFLHLDRSPLGSASGYGVALELDRPYTAELLAFGELQRNTLAVQNDRGRAEYLVLGTVAATVTDLGRLASDLIWFSSEELGYVKLADAVTTGSSIMPQKRNPDVLELVRATAARLRARQAEIGGVYGGLASGYQRDLQLTKEPFVEGMDQALDALLAMAPVLSTLEVDHERCLAALQRAIGATDAVYQRVAAGEPFRSAYRAVAIDPAAAVSGDPAQGWRARKHVGAPGALDLAPAHGELARLRATLDERRRRVAGAWALLDPAR